MLPKRPLAVPIKASRREKDLLFQFLILANFLEYLEAGAVPALLLQLSRAFHMSSGQLGLLGGVVYLSLSIGGPFAGYLLRHQDHRTVLGIAVTVNNFFTFLWALTPVDLSYSTSLFIGIRFFMGLTQCVICVFLPLWTNQFAPKDKRTSWMGYLQASVPFGVMMGYIIASVITEASRGSDTCFNILCWRWPILIEAFLVTPVSVAIYFIPRDLISVKVIHGSSSKRKQRLQLPMQLTAAGVHRDTTDDDNNNNNNSHYHEMNPRGVRRSSHGYNGERRMLYAALEDGSASSSPAKSSKRSSSSGGNSRMSSKTSSPQKTSAVTGGKLSEEEYLTAPEDMNDHVDREHPVSTGRGHYPPPYNEKTQRDENMSISGLELGEKGGGREKMSSDGIPLAAEGSIIGYGDIEAGQSHLEERERDNYSTSGGHLHNNSLSQHEQLHQGITAAELGERERERGSSQRDQHGNNFYRSFDKIRRVSKDAGGSQRRSSANSRGSCGSRSHHRDHHRDHHHRHGGGSHRSFRRSQDDQDEHSSDSDGSVESNDEVSAYQRSRSNLRRQAISASLFNATSMKDVLRYSCDNLQSMHSADDLVTMVGGARWGKEQEYGGADERSESSGTRHGMGGEIMSSDSLMFSSESTSPPSIRTSPLVLPSSMLDCSSGSGIGSGNHSVRASPELFRSPLFGSPMAPTAPLLPTHHTTTAVAPATVTNDDDHVASNHPPSPASGLRTTAAAWIQGLFRRSSLPAGGMIPVGGGATGAAIGAVGHSEERDRDNHDNYGIGGTVNGTEGRSSFNDSTDLSPSQPFASTLSLSHSMSQSMIYPLSRLRGGGAFSFSGKSFGGGSVTNNYPMDGGLAREGSYGGSDKGSAKGLLVDRVGYGGGSVSMNDLYNMSLTSASNNISRGEKRMAREGLGRGLGPGSGRGKNTQQHAAAPPKYESLKDAIKSSFKSDKAVMKAALEARERKRQAKDRSHAAAAALTTATMSSSLIAQKRGADDSGGYAARQDSASSIEKSGVDNFKEKGPGTGAPRALASLHPPRESRSSSSESGGASSSSASGGKPPGVHRSSISGATGGATDGSPSPTPTTSNSPDPEGHRHETSRLAGTFGGGGGGSNTPYTSHYFGNHATTAGAGAAKGIAETLESEVLPSTHTQLAPTLGSPPSEASLLFPIAPTDGDGDQQGGGMANIIINDNNPSSLNQNRPSPTTTTVTPLIHSANDGGSGYASTANSGVVSVAPSTGKRRDHHHHHSHSPSHRSNRGESLSFKCTSLLPNYSSSGANNRGSFSSALSSTHPVSDSSHLNEHNDYSNSSDSEDDDSVSDDWDDHNPYPTHEFDADPTLLGAAASGSILGIGHHHNGPAPMSMWGSMTTLLSIPVYRSLLAAMAALYFTVTGVQYWGTTYMLVTLHAPLPLVNGLFIVCAATGPTSGVFAGGWAVDMCGGYRGAKQRVVALKVCAVFACLGCLLATPVTFIDNIYGVVVFLWLVMFCGGAVLPACSGIVVSIVPRRHRPVSSSLSLVVFNLFGYCLSLVLSGYLMQFLELYVATCDSPCRLTWGFRLVLFWSYWSFLFIVLALHASLRLLEARELRGMKIRARSEEYDEKEYDDDLAGLALTGNDGSGHNQGNEYLMSRRLWEGGAKGSGGDMEPPRYQHQNHSHYHPHHSQYH